MPAHASPPPTTGGGSTANPGYAWYVLGVFFIAAVLSYTDRLILNLLVDPVRADLGITDTQVSLLQGAAFAVVYALAGLPMGRWADRHGRRNLILVGVVVWSAATILCGLAASYGQLFAARILVGIGEAALAPAVLSMIPDYFPPHRRGTAVSVFIAGMIMGAGVATLAGGLMLDAFQSGALIGFAPLGADAPWRAVLVTLGLLGGLVALLVLTVREPERQERLGGDDAGFPVLLAYFRRNRLTFGLLFGGLTLTQVVDYGINAWTPSLLIRLHGMSATEAGASLGMILILVAGCGTVGGGILSDWLERRGWREAKLRICCAAICLATPCSLFGLATDPGVALALFGLYALLGAMAGATGIAAVMDLVPSEMRGVTTAIQACLYTLLGLGLGPTLVAAVTEGVYGAPEALGLSIASVGLPALLLASVALVAAVPHYRATRTALITATREAQ